MKTTMREKLISLSERHEEIGVLLSDVDVLAEQDRLRDLAKEYAQLQPIVSTFKRYQQLLNEQQHAEQLLQDADVEMQAMAKDELQSAIAQLQDLQQQLQVLLLPKDPNDVRNVYLEIRAGTGGDEAAIFVGDLFRMYSRYAENKGWHVEIVSESESEHGGYKEIITRVCGRDVYSHLKFESGAHRVQRVPETESQGRIHTSACTVALIPEIDEIDEVIINPSDLRIDTFRASGAGGQHVNKTDSAIRITHLPTGMVVECQDDRSQHKNKAKAMTLLQSRLLATEQAKQEAAQAATRRNLVGSGDRSERIRTYNYPQGRVTDHRIQLTLYQLPDIMAGNMDAIIQPLMSEHQADQLTALHSDGQA